MSKIRLFFKTLDFRKLIFLGFIAFFIYIAFLVVRENVDQPIMNGYIRDGKEVPIEVQEKLETESLEDAYEEGKKFVNEQTLETYFFCINTAALNDNYDCVENMLDSNAHSNFVDTNNESNIGRQIYDSITQGRILSGIDKETIQERYSHSIYNVWFLFLDGTKDNYTIEIKEGKITNMKGRI